jgi:hypothetical protein
MGSVDKWGQPHSELVSRAEQNGETSTARGLPQRSDLGGADDWKLDLTDACHFVVELIESG